MRELFDILKDYELMVAAYGQDPDDEEVQADLEVHRAELMEVLQLARRWEETYQVRLQNPLSESSSAPPKCHKHDKQMVLSLYDRPGGPQGNGRVCLRCIDERSVPDGTGHSI